MRRQSPNRCQHRDSPDQHQQLSDLIAVDVMPALTIGNDMLAPMGTITMRVLTGTHARSALKVIGIEQAPIAANPQIVLIDIHIRPVQIDIGIMLVQTIIIIHRVLVGTPGELVPSITDATPVQGPYQELTKQRGSHEINGNSMDYCSFLRSAATHGSPSFQAHV